MHNLDSQSVQLIVVLAVAVTMLLQAFALLAIFLQLKKAATSMRQDVEELRASVIPVLDSARELLAHTGPKIEAAVTDAAAITHNLRRQTVDVQQAANEVIERMRRQSARADSMLTNVMDAADKTASFMTEQVSKPVRQISGLLASAKAVVESLRSTADQPPPSAGADLTRGNKDHKL
jgi:ABC-type transporter Mla subunit MlaD